MAQKKRAKIILNTNLGNDFEDTKNILDYKPIIQYIEPEPIDLEDEPLPIEKQLSTIDQLRQRTADLIAGYNNVSKLIDVAQQRIDARAKDFFVKLDPQKDQLTIAAVKRCFPEKADPTIITYDDYKECLEKQNTSAPQPPSISKEDLEEAVKNPRKTDFGGLANQNGQNRSEISSPASSIQPVNIESFQKSGILAMFAMMRPLIKMEDSIEIKKHLLSAGHMGAADTSNVGV